MLQTLKNVIRFEPDGSEGPTPMSFDHCGFHPMPDARAPRRESVFVARDHGDLQADAWDTQTRAPCKEPFPRHTFGQLQKGAVCTWQRARYGHTDQAALDPVIRPGDPT